MLLSFQCSVWLSVWGALAEQAQTTLIALSIIIVIASLAFAAYILIRSNKDARAEDAVSTLDLVIVSRDDPVSVHKPDDLPAKDSAAAKTPVLVNQREAVPLHINNIRIEPSTARPGQMLTVWFDATNRDSSQIGHQVILKINDKIFNVRPVSILPNTMMHLNFKVMIADPGRYIADVNGTTGIFTIEP